MMLARRAFLRAIGLGLPAGLLLAGCKHLRDGTQAHQQQPRDGGEGGGGGDGGGGGGDGGY